MPMSDGIEHWRIFHVPIPLEFHLPGGVGEGIVREVLAGEYESGYVGEQLRVLDIGANVGAFSIWAAHRWPGSTIQAYEPNPSTFALLQTNTRRYPMIRCHNAAVYPSPGPEEEFFFRGVADGQAGLVGELCDTFASEALRQGERIKVPVTHPRDLPPADVVKIDVEGAEATIVTHGEFSGTSLLLLEFQHRRNLDAIKAYLAPAFDVIFEKAEPWSDILTTDAYRPSLAGDHYGLVYFLRRGQTRLRKPMATNRP
jgi:FkbM family methyltransferase